MPDYETIQFHELNPASSVSAADVLAIDTGTTLLKLRADQMVMSVKGNAEGSYRTGNVNLTPANIGAVNKVGDTMTGQLNVKTNFDAHTTHSADGQFTPINFSDSTGNSIGILRENYTAAGGFSLQIASRDDSSGSTRFNSLRLGFDESGNRTVVLDEPALWRNALALPYIGWTTVTGTTNSAGAVGLGLNKGQYMVVSVYSLVASGSSHICTPFVAASATNWSALVEGVNHSAYANTAVTLKVAYLDFGAGAIS